MEGKAISSVTVKNESPIFANLGYNPEMRPTYPAICTIWIVGRGVDQVVGITEDQAKDWFDFLKAMLET